MLPKSNLIHYVCNAAHINYSIISSLDAETGMVTLNIPGTGNIPL